MYALSRATLLLLLLPGSLAAQATLPVGSTSSGTLGDGGATTKYRYTAASAGVLTVAISGTEDLSLAVTDEDGQALPDGTADRDLSGDRGAEVLSVILPHRGAYLVEVRSVGGEEASRFTIGASWVAMPGFERPPDADGRPSLGRALTIGAAHTDELNPSAGDLWDWYRITSADAVTLAIVTRMEEGTEGDLVLEAYVGTDYSEPTTRSDQDLQGHTGNESVTVNLKAGETVYFKVRSLSDSGDRMPYRVSVARVP